MENLDVKVLRVLRDWRWAGKRAVLATVVGTWGSSPRPIGSIMALAEDGAVVGSVSGGCIEDDLIARYTRAGSGDGKGQGIAFGPPRLVRYGISADEAHRFGLPCGGTLELLIEHNPEADELAMLVGGLEAGKLVRRTVWLDDGAVSLSESSRSEALVLDSARLVNTFGPEYRMLLIGAGQLSECLATMALFCGFAVTVCDPRDEYAGAWSVPGATLIREMPDDVVIGLQPDRRTCIVALTHDPKLDDLALLEALNSEAFYVGAIGSRRNSEARRARLREHFDIDDVQSGRLRGPAGLYIGSKTPPEIAVSIMAEVLAAKNDVALPSGMDVGTAKGCASTRT